MKFYLLVALIFCSLSIKAQNHEDLIGKWKIISFFDGDVYFNIENDSTFLSHEIVYEHPDTADQNQIIREAKTIYGAFQFSFANDSIYIFSLDTTFLIKGTYKVNKKKNKLELKEINAHGKQFVDKIDFTLKDDRLKIFMVMENKKCHFEFKRQ
jgi:hypothetical protein